MNRWHGPSAPAGHGPHHWRGRPWAERGPRVWGLVWGSAAAGNGARIFQSSSYHCDARDARGPGGARVVGGGERGIRTLGRGLALRRFSKALLSTTQPSLLVALCFRQLLPTNERQRTVPMPTKSAPSRWESLPHREFGRTLTSCHPAEGTPFGNQAASPSGVMTCHVWMAGLTMSRTKRSATEVVWAASVSPKT